MGVNFCYYKKQKIKLGWLANNLYCENNIVAGKKKTMKLFYHIYDLRLDSE